VGALELGSAPLPNLIGSIDPDALKIPARRAEYSLTGNAHSPVPAEPAHRWQKEFFENGAAAFQQKARTKPRAEQERIEYLEKKIRTKDEVLAELMAEHVALKKSHGEL